MAQRAAGPGFWGWLALSALGLVVVGLLFQSAHPSPHELTFDDNTAASVTPGFSECLGQESGHTFTQGSTTYVCTFRYPNEAAWTDWSLDNH